MKVIGVLVLVIMITLTFYNLGYIDINVKTERLMVVTAAVGSFIFGIMYEFENRE